MEDGKLTALAVAQDKRAALLPEVPSIDEAGLPGVHARIWIGLLAPAGTPQAIVDSLSKAVNEAIRAEDFTNQMRLQGMELMGGSAEEFAALIRSDTARWDAVVQGANLGK